MVDILLPEHFSGLMPVIPPATPPRGISAEGSFCLGGGGGRTWWAHFEFTRINIDVITTSTSIDPRKVCGVHARRARVEGGRDETDRLRFTREPAVDCDVGSRHRRGDREDVEARRRRRPRILCVDSAAGRRGDRSDGLDGMVPPVDGG